MAGWTGGEDEMGRNGYSDEVNEAVGNMTFGQKREAYQDWEAALSAWEHYGRLHHHPKPADFRDWLADRTQKRIEHDARKAGDECWNRPGYRIARADQLRGWSA